MRPHLSRIALLLPAVLCLLAPSPGALQATIHDVSIVNFDFDPAVVAIAPGDTVRWTNNAGGIPHTSTDGTPFDPMPGQVWDSGVISGGGTYSFAFPSAARYDYFCTIHPLLMFGEVIVGGTGLMVAAVPDDISSGALSNLMVDLAVFNFSGVVQSGDLWLTVVLPNSSEIVIPPSLLSFPTNPISGAVPAGGRLDLSTSISVPGAAPPGRYEIRVKVGLFPSSVVNEDSFEFDVLSP